jgi:hypothetical protein
VPLPENPAVKIRNALISAYLRNGKKITAGFLKYKKLKLYISVP